MSDILKMFNTVMKSLFKKSACEMYPVKKPEFYENTKGHIAIEKSKCILCTLCDKKCPTGAIAVNREARKWEIDRGKCILCGVCIEVCRPNCLAMDKQYSEPVASQKVEVVEIPVPEKKEQK
jgi:ech hydrogenase subunit F